MAKVESTEVDGRKVFSVRSFNDGIAQWLGKLPSVWVEGELTELKRQQRWTSVFFTLKDPDTGATVGAQMGRSQYDALELDLVDGDRVYVQGRPSFFKERGTFSLRALKIERAGLGAHLAALERLRVKLAAEGLFAEERKRPLPRIPKLIGLVTGNDAAAKRDVLTAIQARFPPAQVLVAEAYVQGPRAVPDVLAAMAALVERGVDVMIVARGGGSFEDLLAFSDEKIVRAVAECPVPIITAIGHEQDTPLCDLAADVRASTPSVAGRLVVPDLIELRAWLDRAHSGLERGARRMVERQVLRSDELRRRLAAAPALAVERRRARLNATHGRLAALSPRATLGRGYAIVRAGDSLVRDLPGGGTEVGVEIAAGSFSAVVA